VRSSRLVLRRARSHAGLLALVALLAALVTATLVVALGYAGLAAQDGVTAALRDAGPRSAAVQVHTRLSEDPQAQQAAADEVIGAAVGALPVAVLPSARSLTLAATTPGDGATVGAVQVGADEALAEHAEVTAGTWPATGATADGVPVAVQADAADVLGLAVGDRLVLTSDDSRAEPLTVQVAALWRATDADDPRWFADPLVAAGTDGTVAGPLILPADDLAAVPGMVLVRWTLVPDPERMTPGDLAGLRAGLDGLGRRLLDDDAVDRQGVEVSGDLAATAARVDGVLAAVRGVSAAAAALAVLVGLVVLAQLARLLVEVRGPETVLLRSRGLTTARLARWSAVEGLVVLGVGAVVGGLLAGAGLRVVGVVPWTTLLGCVLATALGGTLLLTALAALRANRALRVGRPDLRRSGVLGGLVLVVAVTAVAVWRLRDLGSPVVTGADGRSTTDLLAVLAVPLALVLVALLAAVLLGPVVRAGEARAARRPGLGAALVTRQIVRRPAAFAATAVLCALTVGTSVLVAGYAGSWQAQVAATREAVVGVDLRVDLGPGTADPLTLVAGAPGVQQAVIGRTGTLTLGGTDGTLVALPADGLADLLLVPAGQSADAPGVIGGEARSGRLPALATERLLADAGLVVGDEATLRTGGQDLRVTIAGSVPVVPGAADPSALLVDLSRVDETPAAAIGPAEIWASTVGDRAQAGRAVARALAEGGTEAEVTTAEPVPAPLSAPAVVVFWIVAVSTLVLAVGGTAAAARALGREREGEAGVLRGLGVGAGEQARLRAAELRRTLLVAAVTGVLGGVLVAVVGARTLVRATAGSVDGVSVAGPLAVHPVGIVLLLGGTAVLFTLVVLDAARRVRSEAATARVRQEAEQ
jgi:hypothetical protein